MTETVVQSQVEQKPQDKEMNFRALENKYQRALEQERAARMDAERQLQESRRAPQQDEDEDTSEPYVDHKKLNKRLNQFGEQSKQQTQQEIQKAVNHAIANERKETWLKQNSDFYDVLQHAEKFAQKDPELAETILQMPEGFERQKLVYKTIKSMGLHQPEQKQASIQEKVDANRRSPYYQPTGVGSAPYGNTGDFSPAGQKNAYAKMQDLKNRLRI